MSDELSEDSSEWIHYQEFAEDRVQEYSQMLEQFEAVGPGPPFHFPEPPDFFPPPPPIPGTVEECETFSSHFDSCDISKESTSSQDPYLHLMSVIVAVFCLIILASCITIFLVWRRRRSKSHRTSLHSYCVSGAGHRGAQLYDDLYLAGHLPRHSNNYTTTNTFYNRNQVDLASFLLQSTPEGQPIYEEIPPGLSDNSSDYVETSGYHTLPIDSEYNESERGLFLVPVNGQHKPLIMSGDFQVPGGKTNKKFFTFHRKTLENNKTLEVHDHDIVNSNILNQFDPLDNCRPQHQPKKTKCGKSVVHSKTLNLQPSSHQRQVMTRSRWQARPGWRPTYQSGTVSGRQTRPVVDNSVSRHNQDNFLPRTAWTDTSGSDDWLDLANDNSVVPHTATTTTTTTSSKYDSDYYERPGCPSPPDLISNKCRVPPPPTSPSVISTSDVTVSPSSSESYPECRF